MQIKSRNPVMARAKVLMALQRCWIVPISVSLGNKKENKPPPNTGGRGSSAGGNGGKHPFFTNGKFFEFQFDGQKWGWVPLGLAVAVGYVLTRNSNTRPISWQEFRTQYLERGEVNHLQVVNRNVVHVYLQRDASAPVTPGVSVLRPLPPSLSL